MNPIKFLKMAAGCSILLLACTLAGAPTATPVPPTPTSLPPDVVVLAWSRTGGIAGFCDLLTITADGTAVATTCESSFLPDPVPLDPVDWAQLQGWLDAYGPYSDEMSDGAVADSMTVTLDFFGYGTGEAGEMEMQSLMDFAARVFNDLYVPPAASGPCLGTANADVTVFQRPSLEAAVFGTLGSGEPIMVSSRSTEGWYGFDPGVAQAGNVGVFRLRWVAPDADVTFTGGCDGLPVAPVISPTACYTMSFGDVAVYGEPDDSSAVLATLPLEGFVAVVGANPDGWLQVDLNDSSDPQDAVGWVSPENVNFNGPCEGVPEVP